MHYTCGIYPTWKGDWKINITSHRQRSWNIKDTERHWEGKILVEDLDQLNPLPTNITITSLFDLLWMSIKWLEIADISKGRGFMLVLAEVETLM